MIVAFLIQKFIDFLLGLMLAEHFFLGIIILCDPLVFRELDLCDEVVDASKNSVYLLLNAIYLKFIIRLDSPELLTAFFSLNQFGQFLFRVLKGLLVYWEAPAVTGGLWYVVGLIKYQYAVFNEGFVLFIQSLVKQVVIRHEK